MPTLCGRVQKKNREQRRNKTGARPAAILLRWRWANNPPHALPSKYPILADLFINDPTCSIADPAAPAKGMEKAKPAFKSKWITALGWLVSNK
jgi:hypothetical protein